MKRLLILSALALGLSVIAAPAALPAGGSDAKGPPCSNITNADWSYSSGGVIDFTVSLQAPACSFVTYSFFVTDTSGATTLASSQTPDSTDSTNPPCAGSTPGGGCVHYTIDLGPSSPSTVCVYATTDIHGHLADSAPDLSDPTCPPSSPSISLTKSGSGASGTFG